MCKIEIHGHVTTIDALKYIFKFNIIILRNIFKGINGCVYRFPWICIALIIFDITEKEKAEEHCREQSQ